MWTRPRRTIAHGPLAETGKHPHAASIASDWPCGEYLLEPPREAELSFPCSAAQLRGRRRRRSLYAAVRAVELEWRLHQEVKRGTCLLTFTTRAKDAPERAMRTFWHWYDKRFGRPHIAWLEAFADESGWHYHAIVPDAPRADAGHTVESIQAEWARATGRNIADVNVDLSWLPVYRKRGKRGPVAYALSYAKKRGAKKYQQEYDDAPLGLHTVLYTQLTEPEALVLRLSADMADFLAAMGVAAVDRPSRCSGGGWLVAVRRRSPEHAACWLRLQLLREVDLAAGVVRTLGIACEADSTARPPGSLGRRRLKARRALTKVTDHRDRRFRTKPSILEVMPTAEAGSSPSPSRQLPAINVLLAQRARLGPPSFCCPEHAAGWTQLDITSLTDTGVQAGAPHASLSPDTPKPSGASVESLSAGLEFFRKDAVGCANPSAQ